MTQIEALYREHGAAIFDYLRRISPEKPAAEDLLQETFLQALRGVDRLAEVESPRAWLFGIARNLVRSARRRRRHVSLPAEGISATVAFNPQLENMRESIARLPASQREAIELRVYYGLTYDEIAEVLDVPVGTVRSRLHHAIRRLREQMIDDELRPSDP